MKYDTIKLGDVCEVLNGDRGHNYPSSTDFVEYGIPFINAGNISGKRIDFDNVDYITKEHYDKLSGAKFRKGDIVICLRGSLGKYALLEFNEGAPASSLAVLRAYAKKLSNYFLFHVLDSNIIEQQINIENNGSSQPNLSAESVKKFMIPLPEMPEQMAIAQVLSDVDSLNSSLQKLIDKKKAIKQGTMQDLLTGKRRLSGFNKEWTQVTLGEISDIKDGTHGTFERTKEGILLLSAKNIFSGHLVLGNETFVSNEDYLKIVGNGFPAEGDILLSCVGTIGRCCIYTGVPKAAFQRSVAFIRANKINNVFLFYLLQGKSIQSKLQQSANASAQGGVYLGALTSIDLYYPSDINEQNAIAKILSDMDQEIEQLEKKLAKYQQIKQGMMQELLTGHIRLVEPKDQMENKVQTIREKTLQSHNQQFDDAVMIAGIVDAFYSDKYPLGRKKIQKLLYLVRRKQQADISSFHKKAAGPYADTIRYKGGEPIAKKNGYIQETKGKKGSSFSKGDRIQQALDYLREWNKQQDIDWLVSEFKYTKVDELELLATVDMAACDLYQEGKDVTVQTIKNLIHSTKEWRDKLKKDYFSDMDIQRALKKCRDVFHDTF